jgi:hypothetical protein
VQTFTGAQTATGGAIFCTGRQTDTCGSGLTASQALTGRQSPSAAPAVLFHPRARTTIAIAGPNEPLHRIICTLLFKTGLLKSRPCGNRPANLPVAGRIAAYARFVAVTRPATQYRHNGQYYDYF